jgi:hypothetical protein
MNGNDRQGSEVSLLVPTHLVGELRQALVDDLLANSQVVRDLVTESDRNTREAAYQTAAERFFTRHQLQTQAGWYDDAPATKPLMIAGERGRVLALRCLRKRLTALLDVVAFESVDELRADIPARTDWPRGKIEAGYPARRLSEFLDAQSPQPGPWRPEQ